VWWCFELMSTAVVHEVLDFWFGAPGSVEYGKPREAWFKKSDAFDARIHERFLPVYEAAAAGRLAHWRDSPLTLLALIIVLDQFPRNLFRESPRAFATDALALESARRMTAMGWDVRLNVVQRQFAYLPFEHAENLDAQRTSMQLFGTLGNDGLLEWAWKHYVIIERFGRFPHRNAVLGRASTAAEMKFLEQPGSRF
jgi:uncharacterized protein (DUF924 family)